MAVSVSSESAFKGQADASASTRAERALLATVAKVVAPTTLITALAFYFGVKRQEALAFYFGIDPSVLGLTIQDYLYRSTDVLVPMLLVAALLGLVGLRLHVLVSRQVVGEQGRKVLRRTAWVMSVVGTGCVAVGVMALFVSLPFVPGFLFPPLSLAFGASVLAYGAQLRQRMRTVEGRPASATSEERWLRTMNSTLLVVLIAVGLFWAAADFADALGRGRAQQLANHLDRLSSVVVYSDKRLHFGDAPGVQETVVNEIDGNPSFRYSGLRLFLYSGGNYFLIPDGWTQQDGEAVILPNNGSVGIVLTQSPRDSRVFPKPADNAGDRTTATEKNGGGTEERVQSSDNKASGNAVAPADDTSQPQPQEPTATSNNTASSPNGQAAATQQDDAKSVPRKSTPADDSSQSRSGAPTAKPKKPKENLGPRGGARGEGDDPVNVDDSSKSRSGAPTANSPKENFGPRGGGFGPRGGARGEGDDPVNADDSSKSRSGAPTAKPKENFGPVGPNAGDDQAQKRSDETAEDAQN